MKAILLGGPYDGRVILVPESSHTIVTPPREIEPSLPGVSIHTYHRVWQGGDWIVYSVSGSMLWNTNAMIDFLLDRYPKELPRELK